jgi:hypothetical protein
MQLQEQLIWVVAVVVDIIQALQMVELLQVQVDLVFVK